MKKFLRLWIVALSAWGVTTARGQTVKISAEPIAPSMTAGDDFLINSTNSGAGTWTTKRINLASLLNSTPFLHNPGAWSLTNVVNTFVGSLGGNGAGISNQPTYLFKAPQNWNQRQTREETAAWNAYHGQAFYDSYAWVEPWNNVSNWASANLVLSNNAAYAQGSGNPSGANRTFVMGPLDEARITGQITISSATGSGTGLAWIGVSGDPAGSTPTAADPGSFGIGLDYNQAYSGIAGQTVPIIWNKGVGTTYTNLLLAGNYTVEICIDTNIISVSLIFPGHTNEITTTVTRATMAGVSNVNFWVSDTRGFGGMGIKPLGARLGPQTSGVRGGGIEGNETTVNTTVGADNIRVWLPPNYDSRVPIPLVLFCHGDGWRAQFPWAGQSLGGTNGFPERSFFQSIITNTPCIVASSDLAGDNWGNAAGVAAVSNLLVYCRHHYSVSSVFVMGASMGGLTSLNFVQQHAGEVTGWIGLYPVCSLQSMTNLYWGHIDVAYPLIGSLPYEQATAGYDPMIQPTNLFWRVPMRFYANTSDTTVVAANNSIPFANMVSNFVSECGVVLSAGTTHGDPLDYNAPDVTAFIQRVTDGFLPSAPPNNGPTFANVTVNGTNTAQHYAGKGDGLWGLPFGAVAGSYVTNGQAGINQAAVNGPAFYDYAAGHQYSFTGDTSGFAWNKQDNSASIMALDNSGNLTVGNTIASVGGIAGVDKGVNIPMVSFVIKNQTNTIGPTFLFTTPNDGVSHVYTLTVQLVNMTSGSAGTVQGGLQWTDPDIGANGTLATTTFNLTATPGYHGMSNTEDAQISPNTTVTYSFTTSGNTGGAGVFKFMATAILH